MANKPATIRDWIKSALRTEPPRSKSLIVTILGDAIALHSDGLWLSEMISLLEPFKINERLVRTSSFRLVEEGWLESRRDGRRSRYALTGFGKEQLAHAHARIYEPPPQTWDGQWTLVILSKDGNAVTERLQLRHELEWEGFGLLATNIFLHPAPDLTTLNDKLKQLDLSERAMVLQARDIELASARPLSKLVNECWSLEEAATRFGQFIKRFQILEALLSEQASIEPQAAFVAQTLLIHAYRRATLHDPRLPTQMLSTDWPGTTAYELCRRIYAKTQAPTHRYLDECLSDPPQPIDSRSRFGA